MYFLVALFCNAQFIIVHGILGGYDITIAEAPYQVNYGDICGGVLIHAQWAMTTAHCGREEPFIRVGSTYRRQSPKIMILAHIIHPRFAKAHEFDFDVQLLHIRKLHLNKNIKPIKISGGLTSDHIYVTGWGFTVEKGSFTDVLRRTRLRLIDKAKCQGVPQPWYDHSLTDRMFCAEGTEQDACQGDSGGPAVSSGMLIGISSFGYGCGRVPGVYINVSDLAVRKWIWTLTGVF